MARVAIVAGAIGAGAPAAANADGFSVAINVHGAGLVTGGDSSHKFSCQDTAGLPPNTPNTCFFSSAWVSGNAIQLQATAGSGLSGWSVNRWALSGTTPIACSQGSNDTSGSCDITFPLTCLCHQNEQIDVYFTRNSAYPATAVTSGPSIGPGWSGPAATFTYMSESDVSFTCRVYPAGSSPPGFGPCPGSGGAGSDSLGGLAGGRWTFDVQAVDIWGNHGPVSTQTWTVDTSPPGIYVTSPAPNAVYPQHQAVPAGYGCSDNASGVALCQGPVANGQLIDTSSIGPHTFTVQARDAAGNVTSTTLAYTVADSAPPTVSVVTPATNATYGRGQTVPANYSCQDEPAGSGIASCDATVANGASIDTSTLGTKVFTVVAKDKSGNQTTSQVTYSVIDVSPPTIHISSPSPGQVFLQGQSVAAGYSCQDDAGGSGIAACTGPVANGARIDTSKPGTETLTVQATDGAGNSVQSSVSYTVAPDPVLPSDFTLRYGRAASGRIEVLRMTAYRLLAGSTAIFSCHGRGCPSHLHPVTADENKSSLVIRQWTGAVLRPGATIKATVTAPLSAGIVVVWHVTRSGATKTEMCLPPGGTPRPCTA